MRSHDTHARDKSLRKLTRINRWLIAGSVALTGLFAEAAAHAFPGKKAARPAATATKPHTHATHHRADRTSSTHAQSLNPPRQSPQATTERASRTEEAPPQEAPPAQEASHEATPAQGSTPAREPAPEQEPADEATPAEAPPVVSGGS
jgi:hypothetical protein